MTWTKTLCAILAFTLAAAPVVAAEGAVSPTAQAADEAVGPEAAAAEAPEPVRPGQPAPPALPSVEAVDAEEAPEGAQAVDPGLPKDELVAPAKPKPEAPVSRFKASNFWLGFLGGALLGGGIGVLVGSQNGASPGVNAALYGGAAGVSGGLLAYLLGATSPEEAKPPQVDGAVQPGLRVTLAYRF